MPFEFETDREKQAWNLALTCAEVELMCPNALPGWEKAWVNIQRMKVPCSTYDQAAQEKKDKFIRYLEGSAACLN